MFLHIFGSPSPKILVVLAANQYLGHYKALKISNDTTTVGVQDKDRMRNVKEKLEGENQSLVEKFKHLDLAQAALIKKHAGEVESLQEKYDREVI